MRRGSALVLWNCAAVARLLIERQRRSYCAFASPIFDDRPTAATCAA